MFLFALKNFLLLMLLLYIIHKERKSGKQESRESGVAVIKLFIHLEDLCEAT